MPTGNYVKFIEGYLQEQGSDLPKEPGDIVATSGEVLGRHNGLHPFTVGQRKGLGLSGGQPPMYVVALDRAQNRLVVGEDQELRRTELRSARRELDSVRRSRSNRCKRWSASAIVTNLPQRKSLRSTPPRPASPSASRSARSRRVKPRYFTQAKKSSAADGFAEFFSHANFQVESREENET